MKKNKLVAGVVLAGSLVASGSALAGPNPFRDCGIGAAIFSETHWAAVISNVIWDLGTTAVTSATMSPSTCNGSDAKTAKFIIENYDNLAEETAKGSGDHLTAMLSIVGCSAKSHPGIISSIRGTMASRVNSDAYSEQQIIEKASSYYDAVNTAIVQNGSCSV